eukprot:TRINITY_DN1241_c0_g1_i1.p1 TRINITY_DN1241_c0_g1~~TRINITY_DN1241_c0_g1_i1.p1  ORF type:complete len:302 (-),score=68.86 TRINITY_DN1241_c0_g1_i1:73-978(-)
MLKFVSGAVALRPAALLCRSATTSRSAATSGRAVRSSVARAIQQQRNISLFSKSKPQEDVTAVVEEDAKAIVASVLEPVLNPPTSFTVPVFDWAKNQVGTVELPKHIFGVRVRPDLLHRYVVWHRANKRLGVAKMKSRSEKSGAARKIRPQKGQGKARTSTIRAPQKRGGGRAIPKRQKDWSFKMSIKTRHLALKSALASKFAQNKLVILNDTEAGMSGKTKDLEASLKNWGWDSVALATQPGNNEKIVRASRSNIKVKTFAHSHWNVYDILKKKTLVLTPKALEWLAQQYPPLGVPKPAL